MDNIEEFQSTLPRRERPTIKLPSNERLCFNPRSREGSDLDFPVLEWVILSVSIHAPAKGATVWNDWFRDTNYQVSIHAPAKGATADQARCLIYLLCFNPRSREGSDQQVFHFAP